MPTFQALLPILVLSLSWVSHASVIRSGPNVAQRSSDGPCISVGDTFPSDLVLRILPLGASIVFGTDSSDGNGFREDLRSQLIANNASVNYVGEVQAGTMLDNDVSGFPGYRIDQVAPKMEDALPWLPNLILIHIGEFFVFSCNGLSVTNTSSLSLSKSAMLSVVSRHK